jgi:zinc/manganese transport system permease protein
MIELLLWPLLAGLVLTGIHAYFGLHVLARGVVFVDLSLAQVAALGLTAAILAGHTVQSEAGYWYAFGFAVGGGVLFALVRPYEKALQQEAVIGIVYAVSASLAILALDRAPQGAEHIKQLLIGSILNVTARDVGHLAALYAAIGTVHLIFRRALVEVSFDPHSAAANGRTIFLWDVVFYGTFALVVTSSVRIAGVLLVFSYLIVPAALAGLFAAGFVQRLVLAWVMGAAVTAAGLYASWTWDLPTGPAIVTAFGAATALCALGFGATKLTKKKAGVFASASAGFAGLLLVVTPQMDQPWLDALERIAPPVERLFLEPGERATKAEALASIARAEAELVRLRALEQDVRWGKVAMEPEKAERLRQYVMGMSEISAGDQLVVRHLRRTARERQRFVLGLPLLMVGVWGLYALWRGNARRSAGTANRAQRSRSRPRVW